MTPRGNRVFIPYNDLLYYAIDSRQHSPVSEYNLGILGRMVRLYPRKPFLMVVQKKLSVRQINTEKSTKFQKQHVN